MPSICVCFVTTNCLLALLGWKKFNVVNLPLRDGLIFLRNDALLGIQGEPLLLEGGTTGRAVARQPWYVGVLLYVLHIDSISAAATPSSRAHQTSTHLADNKGWIKSTGLVVLSSCPCSPSVVAALWLALSCCTMIFTLHVHSSIFIYMPPPYTTLSSAFESFSY